MKTILVLLDGLADRSYPSLGNRTPLESASTPNMDRLAAMGCCGLYHASRVGRCLPSETAHYLLFGYDRDAFPGRGLLEGAGHDVPFEENDVLGIAHLFHADPDEPGGPVVCREGWKAIRADEPELAALYEDLTPFQWGGVDFRLHRARGNEGILVMSGAVSPFVSDSDPMTAGRPMGRVVPLEANPEPESAERTAAALNAFLSHGRSRLGAHPVNRARIEKGLRPLNFLATQRCGRRVRAEPFAELWGTPGLLIASGAIFCGISKELGMTFRSVRDGNDPGEDLEARVRTALGDVQHGFVHVHTKAPDEAAHRGDPRDKAAVIETLDRGLGPLVEAVEKREDLLAVVTADHATPCGSALIHSGETVPLLMAGSTVRRDRVKRFDEVAAARGGLGLLRGKELMLLMINHTDRAVLHGHRLGARERAYDPTDYRPFQDGNGGGA